MSAAENGQPGGGPAIEAVGLERRYGDVVAVAGVDLTVAAGEIFGFLGPNGAGKTTTVRMLTTLLGPTGGRARVAGYDVVRDGARVRASIGVALQEAGRDGLATGRALIPLHARLFGLSRRDAERRGDELLALVRLEDAADRRVRTYSGGMRRRLDLAVSLVHRPRVLFLDEPTTGLDPASRAIIWDQVRGLREEHGVTIFLTTQYLEEADQLADRVAIIDRGRIATEGPPSVLKARVGSDVIRLETDDPARARVCEPLLEVVGVSRAEPVESGVAVFAEDGAAALPGVLRVIEACGVTVGRASITTPTLDDVFLAVTGHEATDAVDEPAAGAPAARSGRGR